MKERAVAIIGAVVMIGVLVTVYVGGIMIMLNRPDKPFETTPVNSTYHPDNPRPTALCADGSYSYSTGDRGVCSWHGGVGEWLTE